MSKAARVVNRRAIMTHFQPESALKINSTIIQPFVLICNLIFLKTARWVKFESRLTI